MNTVLRSLIFFCFYKLIISTKDSLIKFNLKRSLFYQKLYLDLKKLFRIKAY